MTSDWQRAIPSRGITASRERGSGIPWFSWALFWERLVQSPGSGTYKFGAVAHFFQSLCSLLWLNRNHRPIPRSGLRAPSLSPSSPCLRIFFNNFCLHLLYIFLFANSHILTEASGKPKKFLTHYSNYLAFLQFLRCQTVANSYSYRIFVYFKSILFSGHENIQTLVMKNFIGTAMRHDYSDYFDN